VVENKEFRDFVLYGHEEIDDRDFPHRTKIIQTIFDTYAKEHANLIDDFKVCLLIEILTILLKYQVASPRPNLFHI